MALQRWIPSITGELHNIPEVRHGIRSRRSVQNHITMNAKENATSGQSKKPHAAIPLPERFDREKAKEDNSPQKTVGTKTPGLKKDEDMPVARERKARQDGKEAKLPKH